MSLLQELLSEGKRKRRINTSTATDDKDVPDNAKNNFVAKNSVNKSGAGAHVDKHGGKAPRNRQKKDWKKDIRQEY